MGWRQLGMVRPQGHHPALATHAALPVAWPLGGDQVRLYFSGRDAANRSAIGTAVLRLGDTPRLEDAPPGPVLLPGTAGAFDDAGCGLGCVLADRLYYMGWNVGGSVPWRNAIGLALGDPATGRFERISAGPIMDRDIIDPFSLSYPWVLRLGPADWRMWYGTHLAWGADTSDMSHAIRAATSQDGITWRRDARVVLGPQGTEIAVVRPCVLAGPDGARMWFAARGEGAYSLGHAVSTDLRHWHRDPTPLLEPANWEDGAQTYPSVFEAAGRRWLLYNGAGYGAEGIGVAVWESNRTSMVNSQSP